MREMESQAVDENTRYRLMAIAAYRMLTDPTDIALEAAVRYLQQEWRVEGAAIAEEMAWGVVQTMINATLEPGDVPIHPLPMPRLS